MILYIHYCGNIKLYKENQPHTNYYYSKFIKNNGYTKSTSINILCPYLLRQNKYKERKPENLCHFNRLNIILSYN